jgi:glycosyltransferase involved in cell wall biosynthesis
VKWRQQLEAESRRLGVCDRITWTGMLTGTLKWGAFHAAEVFVLPSHQENFGIAVVEALACGVPVLISNRINIWREIETDEAGLSAGPGTDETTALLEKWLLLDLARKQAMRDNAARCFAARFKSDRAAGNLLQTLREHGVASR